MKWSKRAAAALASLLLLSTVVQAGGADKAPPRETRTAPETRLALPGEAEKAAKIPELTVVTPEPAKPEAEVPRPAD